MKIFKLIFIVIWLTRGIKPQTIAAIQNEFSMKIEENQTSVQDNDEGGDEDYEDDVAGRQLQPIKLFTNDERCNDVGVCSGLDYGDRNVVVTFANKLQIRFTSMTTYEVREPNSYFTLTFINSKFANFPLQLFYSFKIKELDFRNCSMEMLKWDNFLGADKLSILLLSENLLEEIKPSVFSLADNLSFLLLDSNRISILHNDSFKGLEKLTFLDLHNNRIETLPVEIFSYLPSLQQINLAENRIQLIDDVLFGNNPRLFSIHLQRNALREIEEYAFSKQILKYLDVSHNDKLEILVVGKINVENLWAKNCSLSRINIYGQTVHADLQQNAIKELYFNNPEYLETLRLKDNALEQISSLALTTNLITLDVSNNPDMKTLPDMWQIHSLERLDLSNTSLKEIPISVLASSNKLRSLNVSNNQLEEIGPSSFKYLEKLSQFYIHRNNWNCYSLKMLMDVVIKPLKISYSPDVFDNNFPGEYIHGIKCMYRITETNNHDDDDDDNNNSADEDEYYADSINSQQYDNAVQKLRNIPSLNKQEYNQLKFENTKEVEQLRRELKVIVGLYEEKFSGVFNKLNELDLRLKEFEKFNKTLWQQVAIVI